ncbi:MAG: putative Na+-dependent transporter [Rhodobacteraceae bacterium HLUCCA12]|nr:MAG: putative Na+-dependent transporter [Rhodobacteraceae bacterium HLUCCA12]
MADGFLARCARHGRLLLVAGLIAGVVCGIVAQDLAQAMRVLIAPMVVGLLFLAVLRLGVEGVRAGLKGLRGALGVVALLQLAMPTGAALGLVALGLDGPVALGLVLMLSAAPITGSPNLAILSGGDPVPALRQLVLGTALLPLTVIPVFALVPAFGSPAEVGLVVIRLLALIALAGGFALFLRGRAIVPGDARALAAMDGLAALMLAVVVVALMGAVGPALVAGPTAWLVLALVLAVNFALQIGAALIARARGAGPAAPALGIVTGNRNIALFLSVLPAALVEDLLLFIGLYQIPMYLTPLVMAPFYRWLTGRGPVASRQ